MDKEKLNNMKKILITIILLVSLVSCATSSEQYSYRFDSGDIVCIDEIKYVVVIAHVGVYRLKQLDCRGSSSACVIQVKENVPQKCK